MNATITKVSITTTKAPEFIDITEHVIAHVENSGVRDGLVSIYSVHTTCAIKINENEPLLISDMESFLKRIAPDDIYYAHNDFSIRTVHMTEDEEPNGHSHCAHLLLSTSETIPVVNGDLILGTYQSVFLVELDPRSRNREVIISSVGS